MKNKLIFFILFLLFFQKVNHAQDSKMLDSLLTIYNNEQSTDTSKLKALDELFDFYIFNDLTKAKQYLSKGMQLSKKINSNEWIANCQFSYGKVFDLKNELDSASYYYEKAQDYYIRVNDRKMIATSRLNLANIDFQKNDYEKSIQLLETSLKEDPSHNFGENNEFIGRARLAQGYLQLALKRQLIALKHFEKIDDQSKIPDVLVEMANIELELKNFTKAIDYVSRAIPLYEKYNQKYFVSLAKANLGTGYYNLKEYDNALKFYQEGLQLAIETEGEILEGYCYNSIGKVKQDKGHFEEANLYFEKARAIYEEIGRLDEWARNLNSTAENYIKFGKPRKAIPFLNRAIELADSIDAQIKLKRSYELRSQANESIGSLSNAFYDFKKYQSLSDSILNKTKSQQIEELRIIHDLEQKEKELVLFSKNAELDQVKKTRLLISLVAAIGIGTVLLLTQRQRRKKEKELEAERRKVTELENQRLNTELDFKKQELTSKVLQLCRKNEFLQSLNKEVIEFKSETEGSNKHRLEKLSRKINRDMDVDSDWEQFLQSFETVHPHFNKLLLTKYPKLAPNEIRLACLMRMNLETKNIANLLNITPDGVKKARYRMRKKLEKDSSVNLTEYFMNFEQIENIDI